MDVEELLADAQLGWRRPTDGPGVEERVGATADGPVVGLAADEPAADRLRSLRTDGAPHGTAVVDVGVDRRGVADATRLRVGTLVRTGATTDAREGRASGSGAPGRLLVAASLAGAAAATPHVPARPRWPTGVVASTDGWHDGPFYAARPGPTPPVLGSVDVATAGAGAAAVVVRLDVAGVPDADPSASAPARRSLGDLAGATPDTTTLAATLLDHLCARCEAAARRVETLRREWRCREATMGRRVRVGGDGERDPVVGRVVDLTDRGRLVLTCDDGSSVVVDAEGRPSVRVDER
jgi:hypothetical protein